MKEVKEKKKPILFYYIVALAVIFMFNAIARPYYDSKSVKQVDYGTFMNMTEDEKQERKAEEDISEKGKDSQTEKDRIDESVGEQEKRDGDENSQDAKDRAAFEDKVKREAAEAIEKEKKRLQDQADAEKPKEFAVDFETLQVETHVAKPHAPTPTPTPTPDGKKLAAEDLISLFAMSESRANQVVEAIATGRVRNLNYKES